MMLSFDNETSRTALGADVQSGSHMRGGAISPRNSNSVHLTTGSLVGQREGRLPERSPADRRQAPQGDVYLSVQGDPLSHSFPGNPAFERSQFTQAVLDVLTVASGALLFCALATSLGVVVAVIWLLL